MENQTREERYDEGGATPGIDPGRDRPISSLNEAPQCEHNWIVDYMGDPDVIGGQMFFGYCTKCGASSDSPRA